jgi:hypothetical protein
VFGMTNPSRESRRTDVNQAGSVVLGDNNTVVNVYQNSIGILLDNDPDRDLVPEGEELNLQLDLEYSSENSATVVAAAEEAFWATQLLTNRSLLCLSQVVRSYHALVEKIASGSFSLSARFPTGLPIEHTTASGNKVQLNRHFHQLATLLGELSRPSFMTDVEWIVVRQVASLTHELNGHLLREDILAARNLVVQNSPAFLADGLLLRERHRLRPRLTSIGRGSIIASFVAAGAPSLLAIIGALTARSVISKNRSESKKAEADALKSAAEVDVMRAQVAKVNAETSKTKQENLEIALNSMQKYLQSGDLSGQERLEPIVQEILRVAAESNPLVSSPIMAESARHQVDISLDAIMYLTGHASRAAVKGKPNSTINLPPTARTED